MPLLLIVNCVRVTMSIAVTSQRKNENLLMMMHSLMYTTTVVRMILFFTGHVKEKNCCAKVHVSNGRIFRDVGEHTHGPNADAVKANSLLNEMVHKAETTQNTT
jgi:hypothetical protein